MNQFKDYGQTVIENISDLTTIASCEKIVPIFDPEADDPEYTADPMTTSYFAEEIPFSYKKRAVEYWHNNGRRRSFNSVHEKFKKLKQESNLWRCVNRLIYTYIKTNRINTKYFNC